MSWLNTTPLGKEVAAYLIELFQDPEQLCWFMLQPNPREYLADYLESLLPGMDDYIVPKTGKSSHATLTHIVVCLRSGELLGPVRLPG